MASDLPRVWKYDNKLFKIGGNTENYKPTYILSIVGLIFRLGFNSPFVVVDKQLLSTIPLYDDMIYLGGFGIWGRIAHVETRILSSFHFSYTGVCISFPLIRTPVKHQ